MGEIVYVGLMIVIAGIIALELRIPVSILEIIFGVIAFNLLGLQTNELIDFMANVGILGIMFFAGLEINPDILKRWLGRSLFFGSVIYVSRLLIIFIVSLFLFGFGFLSALLISVSLSTTSLALVYPIIKERGTIGEVHGQMILSIAMIIDLLSMLSLLLFVKPEYETYLFVYVIIALVLFYCAPKITRSIFSRYGENIAEIEVRFVLLFLVAAGFFAEKLMISEVIFAFFLGMIFSEILVDRKDVESKLRGIIFGFLAPVFFFKAGMLMDIRHLNWSIISFIIIFGSLAYLSVYIITRITFSKWFNSEIGKCAGLIFNFRLSFGIIAAIFGLRMGLITVDIYTGIVIIILLASIASSIALRFVPPPELVE